MANNFSKEERVAFEQILEGFEDSLVLSKNVSTYSTDQTMMERTSDVIWRPQPYIMDSYDGMDQSANFADKTQLAVPAQIGFMKSVPWVMDAKELRDALQEDRLGKGAKQKLASDINVAIMNVAALRGSLVVPITGAATGFDDVALVEAIMNEQGVPGYERYLALSTRDYNGMAGNLANRADLSSKKSLTAYEKAYVGEIASFDTYKLDYATRLAAAGGGAITMSTLDGATNFYNPVATVTGVNGTNNVDNRFQNITVSATAGVLEGDAFTVAGLDAVHQITKEDTGELKTFRVVEVVDGTTLKITPPMITNQVANTAAKQYQNTTKVSESATAAITWLNVNACRVNPFWQKDALEILPGRYAVPSDSGAAVMRGTTENGIEIVMQKQYDVKTMKTYFRVDCLFGVVNKAPEMSGALIFDQP